VSTDDTRDAGRSGDDQARDQQDQGGRDDERQQRDYEAEEREARRREARERERFRERERQREREREEDLDRVREAEYRHERTYAASDDYSLGRFQVKRDASRLAYAVTRAGTEVAVGATQIFGNLIANLAGSFLPYVPSRRRDRYDDDDGDRYDDRDRYDRDRYDRDDGDRGGRGRGGRGGRYDRDDDRGGYGAVRGRTRDAAWTMSEAIRDAADVVARSSDHFVEAFDDTEGGEGSRGGGTRPRRGTESSGGRQRRGGRPGGANG
jgi:hypothetical protein